MFNFLAFAGALLLGVAGVATMFDSPRQAAIDAESRARRVEFLPETAPIRGFQQIVNAEHGEIATFEGYLNPKGVCFDHDREPADVCKTTVSGDGGYTVVRLRKCSPSVTTDCILWTDADGRHLEYHRIRAIDSVGEPIDFLGETLVEPPNSWMSNPRPLRLTGRVSRVYGKGRIVEPIKTIEAID